MKKSYHQKNQKILVNIEIEQHIYDVAIYTKLIFIGITMLKIKADVTVLYFLYLIILMFFPYSMYILKILTYVNRVKKTSAIV